jgi:hypothetical protein
MLPVKHPKVSKKLNKIENTDYTYPYSIGKRKEKNQSASSFLGKKESPLSFFPKISILAISHNIINIYVFHAAFFNIIRI